MIDVFSQGYEAALLFCLGIWAGLFYDLLSWVGARGRALCHACDAVFVLLFGALLLCGTLLASNGNMRAFYVIAFVLGALLSGWAFGPLFAKGRFRSQKIRK